MDENQTENIETQEIIKSEISIKDEPIVTKTAKNKKLSLAKMLEELHETDKFGCYYCDKEFVNRNYLHKHYKVFKNIFNSYLLDILVSGFELFSYHFSICVI